MIRLRALALLLAVVVAPVALVAAGPAAPAAAHATLVASDPAEGQVLDAVPGEVRFSFSEPVSLPAQAVQVFDAAGEPVTSQSQARDEVITTDLPDGLADGSYAVVWRAFSADGHPLAGSLTFAIGAPSPEVVAPQVAVADPGGVRRALSVVQAVGYVGLLTGAGLVLFLTWIAADVRLPAPVDRRLTAVLWTSVGVALLAAVAAIPLAGAYQQGLGLRQLGESAAVDPQVVDDHMIVLFAQLAGFAVAVGNLDRTRVALAGAAGAALSPAVVGHARASEPVWLLVTSDAVHLAAGAAWLGGLVGLALTLRSLSGRERDAAGVLTRFSVVAAGLLGLLAVTGTLMGWRILGGWAPLFETTYGRLLLVKVGVAAVVAAAAGYNRYRLLPAATATAGPSGHQARRRAVLGVRGAVSVEAALLVVLLGVTGFLTNQSPREGPAGADRAPVASRVEVGVLTDDPADGPAGRPEGRAARVLVTMTPRATGPVAVAVQVQDATGEPVDGSAAPTVSLRLADPPTGEPVDLGDQAVVPVAAGTYAVEAVLPAPGTWEVRVGLRADGADDPVTVVEVEVP